MKISSAGKLLMQPTLCKLWANNESENYKEHDERNMILVKCARRNQFLQQRFVFQFSFSKAHIQNLNEPFALLQKCNFCRWKATPSFEVGLKSEGYFILWWSPVWWLISKVMIATISGPHLALSGSVTAASWWQQMKTSPPNCFCYIYCLSRNTFLVLCLLSFLITNLFCQISLFRM